MSAFEDLENLQRPKKFVQENPELTTDSGMAWLLRNRDTNGLSESGAILKVRNRIFIHKDRFAKWFLSRVV